MCRFHVSGFSLLLCRELCRLVVNFVDPAGGDVGLLLCRELCRLVVNFVDPAGGDVGSKGKVDQA
jgi:hypothetical protein